MKNKGFVWIVIVVVVGFFIVKSCSGGSDSNQVAIQEKTPVDKIVQSLSGKRNFSIVLYDMDAEGEGSSTIYKHKYEIIEPKNDTVVSEKTQWYTVSDVFFQANVNNLGMEIAYKKDGKLHKEVAPAGYSNYIGNEKYGQWEQRNGNSFWAFYGQYAFMSSMFHLATYPVRRSYYDDYHGGYYGPGRSYYGGQNQYGTRSYTNTPTGKNSTWSSKSASFKSNVRSRVSQSAQRTKAARTSRSASRSSSRSSYRSRSGGFGK